MLVVALSALIPLVIGFVWYHPKVFGNAWMKASGLTEESIKGANMAKIFIITLIFSFFAAFSLSGMVIHQFSAGGLFQPEGGVTIAGAEEDMKMIMEKYGKSFRTFHHGVLHGALVSIFFILPIFGTNALFERKGFKYIAINVGYWLVSLMIMGGVICRYA
jgi:hypothetical protein